MDPGTETGHVNSRTSSSKDELGASGRVRVIGASVPRITGSVLDELLARRESIGGFNASHDLRSAYLHSGGWLFQWLEGPSDGVEKALRVTRSDPRHLHPKILHHSAGAGILPERLHVASSQGAEKATDVALRLSRLNREQADHALGPVQLWSELAAPLRLPGMDTVVSPLVRRHRVAVVSGYGESVELVHALANRFGSPMAYQRFARGEPKSVDVGAAYADLPGPGHVTRLQALSRRSLRDPMLRLLLGPLDSVALMLGTRPVSAQRLAAGVADLLQSLELRPAIRLAGLDHHIVRAARETLEAHSDDIALVDLEALRGSEPDALFALLLGARAADGATGDPLDFTLA